MTATNPFARSLDRLRTGNDSVWLFPGDSTTYGYGDLSHQPGFGEGGYPRFLADIMGTMTSQPGASSYALDINVRYIAEVNGASWSTGISNLLYTAQRGSSAPTLWIRNGGTDGATLANANSWLTAMISSPTNLDLVFLGYGLADMILGGDTDVTYPTKMLAYVDNLRSALNAAGVPGVPICVSTQNDTSDHNHVYFPNSGGTGTYEAGFENLLLALTGYTKSYIEASTPGYLPASTRPNVWAVDTLMAWSYSSTWTYATTPGPSNGYSLLSDQWHPNSTGYSTTATWISNTLIVPYLTAPINTGGGSAPVITTTSLGAMTVGTLFTQTLLAQSNGAITWGVSPGSTLPSWLSLNKNSSTGVTVLTGTPTTGVASYDFSLRAFNSYGYQDQEYSGSVSATAAPAAALFTSGFVKSKCLMAGNYYPTKVNLKTAGSFQPMPLRD